MQLPQGNYTIRQGTAHTTLTALSGGVYDVELRPDRAFDFQVSTDTTPSNEVKLRIHAEGAGSHTLEIRTSNLDYNDASVQKIELRPGRDAELTSTARITNPGTPWVMVVIPDGLLNEHREVTGSTRATK